MDLITQVQNYVSVTASLMAHTIEHVQQQTATTTAGSNAAASAAPVTSGGTATAVPVAGSSSSAAAAAAAATSGGGNGALAAAIAADDAIEEKASIIFQRFMEADLLMGSLPALPAAGSGLTSESDQLRELQRLQALNEAAQRRLDAAQQKAAIWQKRVSSVLSYCADRTYAATATPNSASATSAVLPSAASVTITVGGGGGVDRASDSKH